MFSSIAGKARVPALACLLAVVAGLFIPRVVTNSYYLHLIIMGYIWAIAVYGMNVIVGYTGQLSLAHSGFVGIGAYATGLLTLRTGMSFWTALPLACLLSGAIAFLAGLMSLRTRRHYFAICTLCMGVCINVVIERWDSLTGGMNGLIGIPAPNPVSFPLVGRIRFTDLASQYYLCYAFLLLSVWICYRISNSLVGRTLRAIKGNETLAEALGINVMLHKTVAFLTAAVLAGIAGALFAGYVRFLGPRIADKGTTFDMLLYLFVGGNGSLAGPLVGSLLVSTVFEALQVTQRLRLAFFGPVLVLLIMFFPQGLVGGVSSLFRRWASSAVQKRAIPMSPEGRQTT